MKKIVVLSVIATLTFSMIGCSNQKNNAIQKEQKSLVNAVTKLPDLSFAQLGEEQPNKNFPYEYGKNISFNGNIEVYKLASKNIDKASFKELAKKCKIEKIEVAYFENPNSDEELYLYPVYKLTGQTIDENGKADAYIGIIQATE